MKSPRRGDIVCSCGNGDSDIQTFILATGSDGGRHGIDPEICQRSFKSLASLSSLGIIAVPIHDFPNKIPNSSVGEIAEFFTSVGLG